jgi:hypothetical protein
LQKAKGRINNHSLITGFSMTPNPTNKLFQQTLIISDS